MELIIENDVLIVLSVITAADKLRRNWCYIYIRARVAGTDDNH